MATPSAEQDLSKLTVPQLKALCKERQITGYSKLAKPALLQQLGVSNNVPDNKTSTVRIASSLPPNTGHALPGAVSEGTLNVSLSTHAPPSNAPAPAIIAPSLPLPESNTVPSTIAKKKPRAPKKPKGKPVTPASHVQSSSSTGQDVFHTSSLEEGRSSSTFAPPVPLPQIYPAAGNLPTGSKRPLTPSALQSASAVPKKKKTLNSTLHLPTSAQSGTVSPAELLPRVSSNQSVSQSSNAFKVPAFPLKISNVIPPTPAHRLSSSSPSAPTHVSDLTRTFEPPSNLKNNNPIPTAPSTGKRFRPLVVKKVLPSSLPPASQNTPSGQPAPLTPPPRSSDHSTLTYLDFPCSPSASLAPITLPPKMSQRRRVHRWAIILSGLSPDDRKQCVLVSRMFRYAVYLSSVHRLTRDHDGLRLAHLKQKHPQNMTNMWPYLRLRDHEVSTRQRAYRESFFASFFKTSNPISQRLWTSPDHEKQLVVALRFIMTRLWFFISVGGGGKHRLAWARGVVVDTQEIIKDEIWNVTVQYPADGRESPYCESFYVLESTCEVVGHPTASSHSNASASAEHGSDDAIPVRADWSAYIAHRLLPPAVHESPPPPLSAHLYWQNHEEFDKGISKLWLTRIACEGERGAAKGAVAERYVLACVVGNSVSGRWMSSTQMEQDFAGLPLQTALNKPKSAKVHLFLPAHHHVESIHFTAANGTPLHPAIAVVQTPGREYYILKDNGMQIGCEEEGIAPVWMELLRCNSLGLF